MHLIPIEISSSSLKENIELFVDIIPGFIFKTLLEEYPDDTFLINDNEKLLCKALKKGRKQAF